MKNKLVKVILFFSALAVVGLALSYSFYFNPNSATKEEFLKFCESFEIGDSVLLPQLIEEAKRQGLSHEMKAIQEESTTPTSESGKDLKEAENYHLKFHTSISGENRSCILTIRQGIVAEIK